MTDTIAIVGGGPAGTLTAIALLDRTDTDVTIVEPRERLGPGLAFATSDPAHVLNSRAGAMSADPDAPDDFVAWSRCRGIPVTPSGFPARSLYGQYLHDRLEAAGRRHSGRLRHVRASVCRISPVHPGWQLTVAAGEELTADRVVLALGHAPPAMPAGVSASVRLNPRYVADPWRAGAFDEVPPDAEVLLLGTGLTAIDTILTLANRGHRGRIVALSRHGLLPLEHPTTPSDLVASSAEQTVRLGELLRAVRRDAVHAGDWRSVVDGLRPRADALWAALSRTDQERFVRHVSRHWEIHRHRMAPVPSDVVRKLRDAGTLTLRQGRVLSLVTAASGFEARVSLPDGATELWCPAVVVNCTGPGHPAGLALVRTLVADGLARADPLHLGVEVDGEGRLVGGDGEASEGLTVIGALRRGRWFETTAIPEIRTQAYELARESVGAAA